ncbi:hypothetical protein TVAG_306200 [Trichomonas vaginalis G3]|uniref:Choline transporter-like protein n=1 Tax=Trichomonas vaginalis (strain ATCC PRA-98 / G3) TaxID=412133 RepID=A2DNB1_TRIV3|nr:choline transmembrane transporter protein [Trichomonas vaginalis G3]EAY18099.1 hypothetical protein TVAG_306200 [Trichomonas vaginalis G3]KAI5492376.1 choline transmembrane transporter protein [Trichomonas vaginalis G3]|eukprot:XP_001579085.1 hypothetical protein [Trichomonas vaginalis G3]
MTAPYQDDSAAVPQGNSPEVQPVIPFIQPQVQQNPQLQCYPQIQGYVPQPPGGMAQAPPPPPPPGWVPPPPPGWTPPPNYRMEDYIPRDYNPETYHYEQHYQEFPQYQQQPLIGSNVIQQPVMVLPDGREIKPEPDQSTWYTVTFEETKYTAYWNSYESFEPKNYRENSTHEKKWNDWPFAIIFLIVFLINIILGIIGMTKISDYQGPSLNKKALASSTDDDPYSYANAVLDDFGTAMKKGLFSAIGYALLFNVLHGLYAIFLPSVYIKFSFVIPFILTLIVCVILTIITKIWYCMIPAGIDLIFTLCCCYCFHSLLPLAISIFKQAIKVTLKYPGLILANVVQGIITAAYIIFMVCEIIGTFCAGWNFVAYIWVIFSAYWFTYTNKFVEILITAGVAGTHYFLLDTEYMPKSPTLESTKRATTTSFGSACKGGLIVAIIELLEYLAENTDGGCLRCIALCILCCLRSIVEIITHYGLIYCALYGIPYWDGCKRFIEATKTHAFRTLLDGVLIRYCMSYTILVFAILLFIVGFATAISFSDYMFLSLMCGLECLLFFSLVIEIICGNFCTICDTLFVCFGECPFRMKVIDNEFYELTWKEIW